MATSHGSSSYEPIYQEDLGVRREPTDIIMMSTFGPHSNTRSTEYIPSPAPSRNPLLTHQDSDAGASDYAPRFASWRKPFFSRGARHALRSASWKPFTFKAGFLVTLFLATVALIVILELVNRKAIKDGGLFFAKGFDKFETWQIFCYRYLPTTLAVIYGMVWAVLDLDVKRLEPYFQLSKLEGVVSKDSILLNYPFEFLAYAPIAGFRRRHWAVFLSGFALIITFWVITPLQSSILAIQVITRTIPTSFILSKELVPFDKQRAVLTTQFQYAAYGVAWLGEEVAPFLTREYAAIPYKPLNWDSSHVENGGNESWAVETRVYSTKVDCSPAASTVYESLDEWGYMWYLTDDLNTCKVGITPISSGIRNIQYFGVWGKGLDTRFVNTGCNDTNLFVGVWAKAFNKTTPADDNDVSAIFCRTSYFYADTVISVDSTTLRINNSKIIEPSERSTPFEQKDNIIDIETVEMDMLNIAQMSMGGEPYIYRIGPSSTLRFDSWNLSDPSRMTGYIIASRDNNTFDDFKDPEVFGKAVEKAHQLLFSNAVYYLLQPIPKAKLSQVKPVAGSRSIRNAAIVTVSDLVYILEACLALVALSIVAILFIYRHRRNNLFSDPDSLSAKMALVADSKPLLEDFEGLDDCPEPGKCLPNRRYRLDVWADGTEHYRLDRVHIHSEGVQKKVYNDAHVPHHTGAGVMPLELRLWVGVTLTITLFGLLVFLCILYKSSLKYNGLPTLTDSQTGVQIIFSFIPTVIATLIEPLWVIITRSICAYQPYIKLYKGNASTASSLSVKYTNLPAALVLPRALRSGNFLISSLSAITLLANFLAVALAGLFENAYLPIAKPHTFTQMLEPLVRTQMEYGEEQYLLANTNISAGTSLPPFVSSEFYFLPFAWDTTTDRNGSDLHKAVTRGFGANVTCKPLESEDFHLEYYTPVRLESGSERNAPDRFWANNFNVTVPTTNGTGTVNCTAYPASEPNQKIFWTKNLADPPGTAAGEFMLDLEPTAPDADQDTWDECLSILILGWARGTISYSNQGDYNFSFVPGTYESTTLLCQQEIYSAEFEIVVDGSQRVQSYHRVSPFDINNPAYFLGNSLTNFTAQMGRLFMAGSSVGGTNDDLYNTKAVDASMDEAKFHNDSTAVLFPHLLVGTLLGNTGLTDPATPVPSFDLLNRGFQDFYKRLFAISLSLNSNRIFTHATTNHTISGTTIAAYKRISMSKTMFLITAVLLGMNILIAIVTWTLRPKRFLPRFPDNLAAEIGFWYASQALRDVSGTVSMSSRARDKHLESLEHTYGYGVYIGEDGKRHRGVERQSLLSRNEELGSQEHNL